MNRLKVLTDKTFGSKLQFDTLNKSLALLASKWSHNLTNQAYTVANGNIAYLPLGNNVTGISVVTYHVGSTSMDTSYPLTTISSLALYNMITSSAVTIASSTSNTGHTDSTTEGYKRLLDNSIGNLYYHTYTIGLGGTNYAGLYRLTLNLSTTSTQGKDTRGRLGNQYTFIVVHYETNYDSATRAVGDLYQGNASLLYPDMYNYLQNQQIIPFFNVQGSYRNMIQLDPSLVPSVNEYHNVIGSYDNSSTGGYLVDYLDESSNEMELNNDKNINFGHVFNKQTASNGFFNITTNKTTSTVMNMFGGLPLNLNYMMYNKDFSYKKWENRINSLTSFTLDNSDILNSYNLNLINQTAKLLGYTTDLNTYTSLGAIYYDGGLSNTFAAHRIQKSETIMRSPQYKAHFIPDDGTRTLYKRWSIPINNSVANIRLICNNRE